MGLFGFLGEITEAVVKVAVTPITVVKDVVSVATGNEADATKKNIESIGDNLEKSGEKLMDDF